MFRFIRSSPLLTSPLFIRNNNSGGRRGASAAGPGGPAGPIGPVSPFMPKQYWEKIE